jgi:threonine dehydrogenase-like Zn-dependent dehydrogenase
LKDTHPEYCGTIEEVGAEVHTMKPGDFVIGSFFASDNTCPVRQAGRPRSSSFAASRYQE